LSDQEQDLVRIHAWDAYRKGRDLYLAHKQKLIEWGKSFTKLGSELSTSPLRVSDQAFFPKHEDFETGVREFKAAAEEFDRAWQSARDFGFMVDEGLIREIRPHKRT
jgi:hypothetical protein